MATDYVTGGVTYEIDIASAEVPMPAGTPGGPFHVFYAHVRRKAVQGQSATNYQIIKDVGGVRPFYNPTAGRMELWAEEWLNQFGHTLAVPTGP